MLPEGVSSAGPSVSTGRRVVDGWTGGGVNVEGSVGAFLLFLPLPSRSEMRPRPLEELFEPFAPLESLPEPDLPARRENRLSPDFPPPFPPDLPPDLPPPFPPDLPPPFPPDFGPGFELPPFPARRENRDRKSTRLNSSHVKISYAVFCLKKKKEKRNTRY